MSHKVDSEYLKAIGAAWLRYDLGCPIVVFERGIWYWCDKPDIFAVRDSGSTIEVEVKVDFYDFKANFSKTCMLHRQTMNHKHPSQFYFLVHERILKKVLDSGLLQEGQGLLTTDGRINYRTNLLQVEVIRKAKSTKRSKLSLRNLAKLVQCQSNTLVAMALQNEVRKARTHHPHALLQ